MSMTLTGVVANAPVTSLRPSLKRTASQMLEKSEEKKVHCHLTSSFLSSAESFLKWTKEFVPVEQSFRYVLALNKNSLVTLAHLPPARHRTSSSTELNSTCIDVDLPTTSSKTNFDSHTSTEGLEVESGLTSPLTNLPTDWDRTPSPFIRPHHIIEPFQDSKRTATI
ncbi:hypothetical protein BT96DRAFT_277095 [Gymnopus androsaceus JB14]|uniref:Uncharacterized protein n=1 Tax=Gymnopus androsaceus JB14 TaxID=1447944 RepID=A0A6A4H4V2_9AGAR|nr:hypothetical protein BT96DRAFT_277095 [Gymnopus androsaceus JB14]